MKKEIKEAILFIFIVFIIIFLYFFYNILDISDLNIGILKNKYVGISLVIVIIIFVFCTCKYVKNLKKLKKSKYKDKLFNSLVKESNTIYLMVDKKLNKIIYMTKNVGKVLNNSNEDDNELEIGKIKNIFKLPIVEMIGIKNLNL